MPNTKSRRGPYPSAYEAAKRKTKEDDYPQLRSSSYRLAFQDDEFLLRDELRPTRMHLELLKPELIFQEQGIESTIVIFGSSRIPDPEIAQREWEDLIKEMDKEPDNPEHVKRLKSVQQKVKNSLYYQEARKLASLISQKATNSNLVVTTGGGSGIMEAANRGAKEQGGKSIGLNIVLPMEQEPNRYITPELCFRFHYFGSRKMHFMMRAKGLVAFPGGFGTLDEIFEVLTLLQTEKIKPIPIILFGREFWEKIINFEGLVEAGTISEQDLKLFTYVEKAEQAWEIISSFNGL